ncbi:Intramembrane protease RasP/YluC, implicated in cell division based on FtsL cleavage [Minicystis rosea]|nr:Intramembrane protease RasP/YluC, implicated in cell division based on FtsL cleavage [Minicystis rosea]
MASWYSYVISALAIALLMIVHECGHFFTARAFGMRVTKFSIGFGPTFFRIVPEDGWFWFTTAGVRLRMWKHDPVRHGPTIYQVAMIPFLAYVQIAGMNPLEDIDESDKGSYANASLLGRILTIFGGPAANYLFASVFFFLSFFFGGKPYANDEPGTTKVAVVPGRPADIAQVHTGDRIVEVAGVPVDRWQEMADQISKHPNQQIPLVVEREGKRVALSVKPLDEKGKGKIGVALNMRKPVSVKEAAVEAVKSPPVAVKMLVVGLGDFFTGKAGGDQLSGPVGMVKETAKVAQEGWTVLMWWLGTLSAYLGAFNLIPFPALDGGRLMFLGYEATTRRRPNARIEAHIHVIGLFMMLGLMVYATVNDFRRKEVKEGAAAPADSSSPAGSSSAAPLQGGK